MDHDERLAGVARELAALDGAVTAGPIDAPVPTCPDWTVSDLVEHVGGFCIFWAHVLSEGLGRPKAEPVPAPLGGDMAGWLAGMGGALLTELQATEADTPMWTWFEPDQTAAFIARRAVCELAVHRYDAQSARGTTTPIEPATLAVDAIDETFEALVTRRRRTGDATGQTLHLHGTDDGVGAEWLVTLLPDRVEFERAHAKGDLALRASVSDLALVLFRRPPLGEVQRFGDDAVLDAWYREFVF